MFCTKWNKENNFESAIPNKRNIVTDDIVLHANSRKNYALEKEIIYLSTTSFVVKISLQ